MTINKFTKRAATAVAALSLAVGTLTAGSVPANAVDAPSRTASAAVDTTYLQDSLGLPTNTVIEAVTYDRFQWLLKQSGQFAFLIGSKNDSGFPANAVKVDTAAREAGVSKVYWFDPNLSGQTGVKSLDIRNAANINLHANSQTIFNKIWKNVLGQNLGNGFAATHPAVSGSTTAWSAYNQVNIVADDTVVNDAVNPLFDYRSTETPAVALTSTEDLFFTYDKDHTVDGAADKILSWVNLSTDLSVETAVPSAITAAGGGSVIDALGQFEWWKDSANAKHKVNYPSSVSEADRALRYGNEVLTDAADDNGWVIKQITYPELIHLLAIQDRADRNFVILFGGTWCHNTRAVLEHINENAIENGVTTVYNFDLVLDGGTVNGTNGGANPIHVRATANGGTPAAFNFRPSWVYGEVARSNFANLVTEYDAHNGSGVSYYPGADLTAFPQVVRKLQVPFLLNYQRGTAVSPSSTAVKRQWIQRNFDASTGLANFREYMTEQWFTTPSAQLGEDFVLPTNEAQKAALSEANKTKLISALANKAFGLEAVAALDTFFDSLPGYVPTRTLAAPVAYSNEKVVLTLSDLQGRTPTGKATLKLGGKTYTAFVANGVATFNTPQQTPGLKPYTLSYATDTQIAGFTDSGSLNVSKFNVTSVVGTTTSAPTATKTGILKVVIARASNLPKVGGKVTVTLTNGSTVKTISATVANSAATVVLPKLTTGSWTVALAYVGDANFSAATPVVPAPIVVARVR
jgi:hypothetical protein